MRTRHAAALGLLGLIDCTYHAEETPGAQRAADPASAPVPAPAPATERPWDPGPTLGATPSDRRCGEAGTVATPVPSGLMHAVEEVGRQVLAPNDKARIGNVDIEYGTAVDFGTAEILVREPGLVAVIDRRVEPIDGAWGGRLPLPDNGEPIAFEVGPYRVEGHPVGDDPKLRPLEVRLLRRGCPSHAAADWPGSEVLSLWLGSATMRVQTLTAANGILQVTTSERNAGQGLHLRWSWSGVDGRYDDGVEVTPDAVGRRISGLGLEARVAAVQPADGVTFEQGHWSSDTGTPLVAVRLDVRRPARSPREPSPSPSGPGCGQPRSSAGPRPDDAARAPKVTQRVTVDTGTPASLGPLRLELEHRPAEEQPGYHPPLPESWILSARNASGQVLENAFLQAGHLPPMRVDDVLLLLEPKSPPRPVPVRVRRFSLACPEAWQGPMPSDERFWWMGTLGITQASFMGPGHLDYRLHAQIGAYGSDVNLSVSGDPMSYSSSKVSSAIVGQRFRIRDREVEILAVEAGKGTRWDGKTWAFTGDAGPNVLVHLWHGPVH